MANNEDYIDSVTSLADEGVFDHKNMNSHSNPLIFLFYPAPKVQTAAIGQ